MTKGAHLQVEELATVPDLVQAAVCRELGPRAFEEFGAELRARGRMRGETERVFRTISQTVITVVAPGGALPVVAGAPLAAAAAAALSPLSLGMHPSTPRNGKGKGPKAPASPRSSASSSASSAAGSEWVRCSDKFGDKRCRDGGGCENARCGFAHPAGWRHLPASATRGRGRGGPPRAPAGGRGRGVSCAVRM